MMLGNDDVDNFTESITNDLTKISSEDIARVPLKILLMLLTASQMTLMTLMAVLLIALLTSLSRYYWCSRVLSECLSINQLRRC